MFAQFDGGFDADVAIKIAGIAATHPLDAFAPQTELFARLSALGNVDGGFAF